MSAVQRYVNIFAFMGWFRVLAGVFAESPDTFRTTQMVQAVCVVEVLQILPIGLQRATCRRHRAALSPAGRTPQLLPVLGWCLATKGVLMSWAVTEMCRYPMFLQPYSGSPASWAVHGPSADFPNWSGFRRRGRATRRQRAGARDRPDAVCYVLLGVVVTNIPEACTRTSASSTRCRGAREPPLYRPPEPEEGDGGCG